MLLKLHTADYHAGGYERKTYNCGSKPKGQTDKCYKKPCCDKAKPESAVLPESHLLTSL